MGEKPPSHLHLQPPSPPLPGHQCSRFVCLPQSHGQGERGKGRRMEEAVGEVGTCVRSQIPDREAPREPTGPLEGAASRSVSPTASREGQMCPLKETRVISSSASPILSFSGSGPPPGAWRIQVPPRAPLSTPSSLTLQEGLLVEPLPQGRGPTQLHLWAPQSCQCGSELHHGTYRLQ